MRPWSRTVLPLLGLLGPALLASGVGCSKTEADDGSANLGVNAVLFIKRAHTVVDKGVVTIDVSGGNGQVIDYDRYVPGGSLNLLAPARPDGTLHDLTADFPTADFNGADVSFDAHQAVFSMKKDANDHYHIYTVQLDVGANGKYEIHQKTGGNQDDINPIYIPGGRIAFVTNEMYTDMGTRADEYEHARAVTQLATISVDGGDADRRLFPQNLSHTVAPFLRYDGKIGYSRWEHLGPVNDVKIFTANPDGTNMLAVAGQHDKPANSLFSIKEIAPNVMIGVATARNRTIHAGALIKIDMRNSNDPACMTGDPAQMEGHACLNEEKDAASAYKLLTPDVPTENGPSPVGRYREPSALPDGRLLVSWADGPVNDLSEQSETPPDFGIYVYDANTGKNQLVYNDRQFWDLNALAVAPHTEPPVIGDLQHQNQASAPVRIGSIDVTQTSLPDTVDGAEFSKTALHDALGQAVAVRVIEGFSSEAAKGVTMFGLTMHEGAAVLGEAPVYSDGSWLANIPPYVPVHLQPIDKFGMAIRSQGLWIQGAPGEDRRCIGCHESRTGQGVPRFGQNPTVAEQKGPEAFVEPVASRYELPWDKNDDGSKPFMQKVFDDKCVQCHNASTSGHYTVTRNDPTTGQSTQYQVPTLDLSSTPVTVYYDKQVKTWNASYVSIFYASALDLAGQIQIMGDQPKLYGVPASARTSLLIQKVNVKAPDGTWAFTGAPHPEDKQVTLTDDERHMLVLAMDLGGQYFARQNTQFQVNTDDPTAPK